MATTGELLYEGKAKKVYRTEEANRYIVEYKDDATAFNGQKKGTIIGKGVVNNRMSNIFFRILEDHRIPTHFIEELSDRQTLVKAVKILPLEVVVRNIVAGSLAKRIGIAEGTRLPKPVVEFYYKNDDLGDPLVNHSHIDVLQLAQPMQLLAMEDYARRINDLLQAYLASRNVILVDFKIEFGLDQNGAVILADEISPDTCRFWDATTMEKLDKDRFRQDLGSVEEAYQEMLKRLGGAE